MLSFLKNTISLLTAASIVVATPIVDAAADYGMRCNGEDLNVDNARWIANDLRSQASNFPKPWPCPVSCADNHVNADTSHAYKIEAHGSGDNHVAVTGYTLDHKYDYALCVDAAATIDAILDKCGKGGGSGLARNSDNCVIHVNRNFV